jgi:hypothetical protein
MRYVNKAAMNLPQSYCYTKANGKELDIHEDKLKFSEAHILLVLSDFRSSWKIFETLSQNCEK